jgi:hypothetical protein
MGGLRDAGQNVGQSQVVAGRNRASPVSPRAPSLFRSQGCLRLWEAVREDARLLSCVVSTTSVRELA